MAGQKQKKSSPKTEDEPVATQPNPKVAVKAKQITTEVDKIVDEIDRILEKNAGEFVKAYVQKGGE